MKVISHRPSETSETCLKSVEQLKTLDNPLISQIQEKAKQLGLDCEKVPMGLLTALRYSDKYHTELLWDPDYFENGRTRRKETVCATTNLATGKIVIVYS